jgi:ABC-type multidrug transport system fused ATPase/permease subunit
MWAVELISGTVIGRQSLAKNLKLAMFLLLLVACAFAVKPTVSVVGIGVINNTKYDTTPNLGTMQMQAANVYYPNETKAFFEYCSISIYRWSANNSIFVPVAFSDTKLKCLEQDNALSNPAYDCNIYTDGAGEAYFPYYIDPGLFELGDVGKTELHCSNATLNSNFTVQNYRPVDSFFGSFFQYLINSPETIFGLFVFMLLISILLVVVLILPVIILKRLFW